MRLLKLAVAAAVAFGAFTLWNDRDYVVSAYREDPTATELRLDELDVEFDKTPVAESPWSLSIAPDARRIRLSTVEPKPEPEVDIEDLPMFGGNARMNGTVISPAGPAIGAVVRVTRHTEDGIVSVDVGTDAGGGWTVPNLLGGRYTVRAFIPNVATSGPPQAFFLEATDKLALDIIVTEPAFVRDAEGVGPTHIVPGEPALVWVTLGHWIVDVEGRLVRIPDPAVPVRSTGFAPLTIDSETDLVTDRGGAVSFLVTCADVGPAGIALTGEIDGAAFGVYAELPPCSFTPPPGPEVDEDGDVIEGEEPEADLELDR